ncbi:sensor histidine kinase [Streptomyces filamentosus]|uniref:histidine kinase n=1 Tax=Streptomyces filamentosus TaxID=67294 RepID=A0A919BTZ6_STRFL|nr:sensor histidine kinase [Streptomyces filamentosus]GHG16809.1 two-component sensor histidine kinase [Streptomyces filamentosus]
MTSTGTGPGFAAPLCARFREHPLAFDALLAAGALVAMIAASFTDPHGSATGPTFGDRAPTLLGVGMMTVSAVALVLRRRRPFAVLAFVSALALIELLGETRPAPVAIGAVIALYTVASRTDRPTTWRVGLATMTTLAVAAMAFGPTPWYAQENLGVFAWTGMAAAAGDAVRSRRAFVDAIRERAERAERTREEEARRRVAEERLRIARDLHDVVAHHIALVNVQAGVAAHVMDRRPDQAKEALAHVREAGRSALDELRATVGLLRQSGDPEAPTEPAPGLAVLDGLLDSFRKAGLPVSLARTDGGRPLPAAVDLAAYRIVQEALTNVRKHAGPDARAEVSVVLVGRTVEVTVLDDGAPSAGPAAEPSGGHGLLGMRERVTALGGSLTTAPRYGGGFRVQAILPVTPGTTREAGEDR